jgi:prepilin-type N-terminal cleavage/methylation domain-containing protein
MLSSFSRGFSLAELMVTLAVVGVVSTLTVPAVMSNVQEGQRRAVFKETITMLGQLAYQGVASGEFTEANAISYMQSKLNAAKVCPTNGSTEGCTTVTYPEHNQHQRPSVLLANGAYVALNTANSNFSAYNDLAVFIDSDGAKGPNSRGVDSLWIYLHTIDTTATATTYCQGKVGGVDAVACTAMPTYYGAEYQFYLDLWK